MNSEVRDKLEAAIRNLLPTMNLLRDARAKSPNDMRTRNAFLMCVKTYDMALEALQRNAPAQSQVESLYNSQDGE